MKKSTIKERFKAFLEKIKNPAPWVVVLFVFLTIALAGMSIAFPILQISNVLVYIVYGLAAICLSYTVYLFIFTFPKLKKRFREELMKYKYTKRYLEDFEFKSMVSACVSFSINMIYAIFQGVMGILSHSIWYGSLSLYYIVLCSIRGGIVFANYRRRKTEDEHEYLIKQVRSYRNCGIYLNILTLALSASIVQMVILNQGYKYAGLMIYVMAAYAFYKLTISIVNIVRAKRTENYTTKSIRNLNLSDALVSILALQTAMFQAFGTEVEPFLFNALTGAGVTLITIIISVIMIVKGTKELNKLKKEKENG